MFVSSISVRQYREYAELMRRNISGKTTDAMFFNKKIVQALFGKQVSSEELGEMDAVEFMAAVKGIHFIMQGIISEKIMDVVQTDKVEKEESAFDDYDIENGYEEEQPEQSIWAVCVEIIDRIVKLAIRLLRDSYSQCMDEDILSLLGYLKFEMDTIEEN